MDLIPDILAYKLGYSHIRLAFHVKFVFNTKKNGVVKYMRV